MVQGSFSPFSELWLTSICPMTSCPSAGTLSPGCSSTRSPTTSWSTRTLPNEPFLKTLACTLLALACSFWNASWKKNTLSEFSSTETDFVHLVFELAVGCNKGGSDDGDGNPRTLSCTRNELIMACVRVCVCERVCVCACACVLETVREIMRSNILREIMRNNISIKKKEKMDRE